MRKQGLMIAEFEIRSGFLVAAEEIVHMAELVVFGREPEYTNEHRKRWKKKKNRSFTTELDVKLENQVMKIVRKVFPGMPILTEEQNPKIPDADIFISLDPLDGTSTYEAGGKEWAISLGIIANGKPLAGIVVQPALRHAIAGFKSSGVQKYDYGRLRWFDMRRPKFRRSLVGADLGPNSPSEYWEEVRRYAEQTRKRPRNLPAVAGGIETLMGIIEGTFSHTFHHWDVAGIATLIQEMGGVIECYDGSEVSWTTTTEMPPLLIAGSREIADRMRHIIVREESRPRYAVC